MDNKMKKNNKSKQLLMVFSVILILSVMVCAISCSPARRPGPVQPAPSPAPTPSPAQPTPTTPTGQTTRAEALAKKISDLKNINSASVVLSGNSCWVGVDLAAKTENKMTNQMKNEITSIVKREEKGINNVYVTADADTVSRLRNIARDIRKGKPVSGFIKELNEIGRRVTPSAK